MKLIKLYSNFKIDSICKKYGIKNYIINSDGSVDVDGDVSFKVNLNKLPLKFGKVSGYFDCSYNFLTTLEGCPKWVFYTLNIDIPRKINLKNYEVD